MIPPCRFYEMHPDGEQYVGWGGHPDEHGQACIWFECDECPRAEEAV